MFPKSSTSVSRPIVRSAISDGPVMKVPPGISTFWLTTADRTWSTVRPYAFSRSPFMQELDLAVPIALEGHLADVLDRLEDLLDAASSRSR